jgi:hypothetical protein
VVSSSAKIGSFRKHFHNAFLMNRPVKIQQIVVHFTHITTRAKDVDIIFILQCSRQNQKHNFETVSLKIFESNKFFPINVLHY